MYNENERFHWWHRLDCKVMVLHNPQNIRGIAYYVGRKNSVLCFTLLSAIFWSFSSFSQSNAAGFSPFLGKVRRLIHYHQLQFVTLFSILELVVALLNWRYESNNLHSICTVFTNFLNKMPFWFLKTITSI